VFRAPRFWRFDLPLAAISALPPSRARAGDPAPRNVVASGCKRRGARGLLCRLQFHTHGIIMRRGQGETIALVLIGALGLLFGCATSKPEMAWVRTDGRKILGDPALLRKARPTLLFAMPILIAARLMKERATAWV
jgi:hypothetical protein